MKPLTIMIIAGLLIIVSALIISNTSDSVIIEGTNDSIDLTFEQIDETTCEFGTVDQKCVDLTQTSVIPTQPKLAESDNDKITNFIESLQGKFDQFGIETIAVKYNINGEKQSYSTIFPIQLLGSVLSDNMVVENLQIAFNAVTADEFSTFNLDGIVEFKLNDKIITTKKLWTSSSLANQQKVALKIVDSIPPSLDNRPETFDFTFTDEGFVTGDTPTFAVIIKSLKGDYTANGKKKTFDWEGEFIAYTLNLTVDESKTTLQKESGEKISVNKSDDKVVSCSVGKYVISWWNSQTGYLTESIDATPSLGIEVIDSNGKSVGKIDSFTTSQLGKKLDSSNPAITAIMECKTIEGLARNTEYTLKLSNGDSVKIKTPNEQHNYNIQYRKITAYGGSPTPKIYVNCGGLSYCDIPVYSIAVPNGAIYKKAVTNFDYDYNTVPCDNARAHYGGISTYTTDTTLPVLVPYDKLPVEIQAGCRK